MEQRNHKIKYRVITFITACCREIYSAGSSHFRCRTGAVKQLMPASGRNWLALHNTQLLFLLGTQSSCQSLF